MSQVKTKLEHVGEIEIVKLPAQPDTINLQSTLSELEPFLSVLECNRHQVQIVAMLYGTCKETLEMHINHSIYALVCVRAPKEKSYNLHEPEWHE